MMEFKLLRGWMNDTLGEKLHFEEAVNEALAQGWVMIGPPILEGHGPNGAVYAMPMQKFKSPVTKEKK